MKTFAIILILFNFSLSPSLSKESRWYNPDYEKYTYESFAKSAMANQKIDFKIIDYALLHAAIFYETNRQRVLNGRPKFLHSGALEKAAYAHSQDMVRHNFFSHSSVVRGKETMAKRLALVGIMNAFSGENISYFSALNYEAGRSVFTPPQNGGYFSYTFRGKPIENRTYQQCAITVVTRWMNSPGHRKNILNPNFKYLGAGVAYFKDEDFYKMPFFKATQNFASVRGDF
jgi:uncharacterized protein YkwD